jgi:hypothetical protein
MLVIMIYGIIKTKLRNKPHDEPNSSRLKEEINNGV